MTFTFSKEIVEKYLLKGYGYFNKARLYKVFEQENMLGEFLQLNETCFLNFAGFAGHIENESNNLIKSRFQLIDEQSQAKIGEYSISGWVGQYGKLVLNKSIYYCEYLKPDISYSVFNKKTWGHYKIQVSDGTNIVVYQFKINEPIITVSNNRKYRPLNGSIQLYNGNMVLLFAGLFFIEKIFAKEDTSMS